MGEHASLDYPEATSIQIVEAPARLHARESARQIVLTAEAQRTQRAGRVSSAPSVPACPAYRRQAQAGLCDELSARVRSPARLPKASDEE